MYGSSSKLDGILERICVERVSADVPGEVVDYARRATRRFFSAGATGVSEFRIRRYFDGVERRRLVRHHSGSLAAGRIVAASVVADLSACGRDGRAVIEELERGWATCLPEAVIEEYRAKLCA